MAFRTVLKSSLALSASLLALSFSPAHANALKNGQLTVPEKTVEQQAAESTATQAAETTPDGWQKLTEDDVETVYIKPPQKDEPANLSGIEVRVVARKKDLFDYAEGVAMADCSSRTLFPASGEIYDAKGNTIDPMDVPVVEGMVYVRSFLHEAYGKLTDRLCEGEPIPESQ